MAVVAPSGPASFYEAFHFDTNQFLAPVDSESNPIDFEDLLGVLLANPAPGHDSSTAGSSAQQSDSGGLPPSPVLTQLTYDVSQTLAAYPLPSAAPLPQQQRQAKKDVKSVRDASKRSRDVTSSKAKPNQVKELEALAAAKSEQLERLTRENSELKFRQHMLEKVVQMQDHQLKVMRGTSEELPQPWCGAQQQQQQQQQYPASGQPHAGASSAAASYGGCSPAEQAALQAGGAVSAAAAVRQMSSGCLLACGHVSLPAVDRERFRSLGKQKMIEGWKHFLAEVSAPLLALEADPEDERAAVALRQLAGEAMFLLKHASLLAPDTVMVVSQTHLESEALVSAEAPHWATVVRTLELSPQQGAELVGVWALFRGLMAGILAERQGIQAKLAEGTHGPALDVAAAMAQLSIAPECEVLQSLQRNMRREKAAHLLLRGFLFGRTLSALQFVKAAVYSYPWLPDATALVACVAEGEQGGAAPPGAWPEGGEA